MDLLTWWTFEADFLLPSVRLQQLHIQTEAAGCCSRSCSSSCNSRSLYMLHVLVTAVTGGAGRAGPGDSPSSLSSAHCGARLAVESRVTIATKRQSNDGKSEIHGKQRREINNPTSKHMYTFHQSRIHVCLSRSDDSPLRCKCATWCTDDVSSLQQNRINKTLFHLSFSSTYFITS